MNKPLTLTRRRLARLVAGAMAIGVLPGATRTLAAAPGARGATSGSPDAGSPDAGSPDAGSPDAGSPGADSSGPNGSDPNGAEKDWTSLTEAEWRERLTPEEFRVLREEGTERAFTSPLDNEKRAGTFVCAGCALPLFRSETKYDSGTGWPSFYTYIDDALGTKRDYLLFLPRTEYHCIRCKGHQGHVFDDGPRPTGKRYCNNGVALDFIPDERA